MSVSDVVVTDKGAFFCDSVGFKQIEFDESQTQKPENLMRVLYVEPGKAPYEAEIVNDFRSVPTRTATATHSTATVPTQLPKKCAKPSISRCLTLTIRRWRKVKTTASPIWTTMRIYRSTRMRTAVWALHHQCKIPRTTSEGKNLLLLI